jgi:hypothetical protein
MRSPFVKRGGRKGERWYVKFVSETFKRLLDLLQGSDRDSYIASSSAALFSKRSSKHEVQFDVNQTTDFSDYGSCFLILITMILPEC